MIAGWAFCLALANPVLAADAAASAGPEQHTKGQIEDFLGHLEAETHGALKWEGADRLDVEQQGDNASIIIENARFSLHLPDSDASQPPPRLAFDHVEIRRTPQSDSSAEYTVTFPHVSTLTAPDGEVVKLTLNDAMAKAVVEAQTNRARETRLGFSGARIDAGSTGDWVSFGPLTLGSKVVGAGDGSWRTPVDFELKQIEFFISEGPVTGAVDRIGYIAHSAGPDLAAVNKMRDQFDALRAQNDVSPDARLDSLLKLLPDLPGLFSEVKGELSIENTAVRAVNGAPLFALAKASFNGSISGLSGDMAAFRTAWSADGLTLDPSILDPNKVPKRAVFDTGVENVSTAALHNLLELASKMRGASEADQQRLTQQMLGAAAMLNPSFRIYDIAVETPEIALDATGETKGSPLSPKGYSADADIAVRGIDQVPTLFGPTPLDAYLPVLKVIGTPSGGAAPGAPQQLKFHLASAPGKWITLNGNDISDWLAGDKTEAGQPRLLHPDMPPISGEDVRAVQRALATAKLSVPQNGSYDGPTAGAVAQYQKQNGLNVDGVVDAATRQKLGVAAQPAPSAPAPAKPGPRPGGPPKQ